MAIISTEDAEEKVSSIVEAMQINAYRGHCGQGLSRPRDAGGLGSSSKFVTDFAP